MPAPPADLTRLPALNAPGTLFLHDSRTEGGQSLLFHAPSEILEAYSPAEALAALGRIEAAKRDGRWVAGYLAYELGLAFEPRLAKLLPDRSARRLLWLGLYGAPDVLSAYAAAAYVEAQAAGRKASVKGLALTMDPERHRRAFETVKAYIAAGDAYQVNLTFKARFALEGDALALYRDLTLKQPVAHGAFLATGDQSILSLSPELFVENRAGALSVRPMKGTRARGRFAEEDEAGRVALAADAKNRAENLMIVDLLRNDLSRISRIGSVKVTDLFTVETYRSLHQMTSGIVADMRADVDTPSVIRNLFPCGSITGAPKIRAMEIIHEVEAAPRGLYTGSIGCIAPDGDFRFNVAIRTAIIDADGQGEIGVGGGIVQDSTAEAEYAEALLKLDFFVKPAEPFALIETLLWERGRGYWLLGRHLARLLASGRHFGIAADGPEIRNFLEARSSDFTGARIRARLTLDARGGLAMTAAPLDDAAPAAPFRFALAQERVDSAELWLFHKTTRRGFYDSARLAGAERLGADEAVFLNEREELTEGSITSLFIERGGVLLTPALSCGLLPGTLRAELLAVGRAREAVLTRADLETADAVFLGNSVRGLMAARWVGRDGGEG